MRELLAKLQEAEQNARLAIGEGDDAAAETAMNDVRTYRKRIEALKELDADGDAAGGKRIDGGDDTDGGRAPDGLNAEYQRIFLKALRRKKVSPAEAGIIREYQAAVMHEGGVTGEPDGDSSLIVPQDIQTTINGIMRELNDLTQYVRQEVTRTLSGSRVLEADEDITPMAEVDEYGDIPEEQNPKFTPVTYKLVKRAGFLPLTNELLADTDQNIINYVSNWIARKVVVTRNSLIRNVLATLDKVTFSDLDGLKKALNVDLDPALSAGAVILTNQDGYHWLDTQKDDNGRYLLQDDPTQPGRRLFKGRPVAVLSNRHFPTTPGEDTDPDLAPMVIGNLNQLLVHFWRGMFELASTTEGGDAWRRDSTELRAITRDDVVLWDEAAAVYGQIELS